MNWRTGLVRLRRTFQMLCLMGFLILFVATEYRGADEIRYPVGLLFRIDPLAAVADALAPGPFSWASLWPALVILVLTGVFGRFFCGWICPLGTLIDGFGKWTGRAQQRRDIAWRRVKYYLLFGLVALALMGTQLIGLFDPLSLFLRTLALSLYPIYNWGINGAFDLIYSVDWAPLTEVADRAYPFMRENLMAFHPPAFRLGVLTFAIFLAILLLEKLERRFWCRNLCPLGALFGLCASHGLIERVPTRLCPDCLQCDSDCRMNAIRSDHSSRSECILCMDCLEYCPHSRTRFLGTGARPALPDVDLTRRGTLYALTTGVFLGPLFRSTPALARDNPYIIRPPGAVAEEEFLRRCIRCGECLKVCIGGALQPALLESGLEGLWSPLVVARHGYCEYQCTLCGQVCPTGAIQRLPLREKVRTSIGLAVIDKKLCLPYAQGTPCLVCEEHCPTPQKAIVLQTKTVEIQGREIELSLPEVIPDRCIGCGICETRCPTHGISAIRIINEGESRHHMG